MTVKPKVLFLCTGNSCRSQMAEAWARVLRADDFEAYSAGIEVHGLNPRTTSVMAEAGVDISSQRSKHVAELSDIAFDLVVTVCDNARESCPVYHPPTTVIHHSFTDPASFDIPGASEDTVMEAFRRTRDEIRDFVETLSAGRQEE